MKIKAFPIYAAIIIILVTMASACGGGSGSGSSDTAASGSVSPGITTSPIDGATDVDVFPVVTAAFDKDMDAATITAGTFTLTVNGTTIAGNVGYDAAIRTATFTPKASLPSKASCTATIAGEIADSAGQALASAYSWTFTLRNRAWSAPEIVAEFDNTTGELIWPQAGIDAAGNAHAVWQQTDGSGKKMWVRSYEQGVGWGEEKSLESDISGPTLFISIFEPYNLSMNGQGDAVVCWMQSDGTTKHALASIYRKESGWEEVIHLENPALKGEEPRAVMGSDGVAFAAWHQSDHIYFARNIPGEGWSVPVQVDDNDSMHGNYPDVAVNNNGDAVIIWRKGSDLWGARYSAESGWDAPEKIVQDVNTVEYMFSRVAMDDSGIITVVTLNADVKPIMVRSLANGEWAQAVRANEDDAAVTMIPTMSLAHNGQGDLLFAWTQNYELWVIRRSGDRNWSLPEKLSAEGVSSFMPNAGLDAFGNALVAWWGGDNLLANSSLDGTTWLGDERLDDEQYVPGLKGMAMNDSGDAIAVWNPYGGTPNRIIARFYR